MKINDKKIINNIKLFPFYIVLITNIIFLTYLFLDFKFQLKKEKEQLQIELTNSYKKHITDETKRVVDYINLKKSNNEAELKLQLKEKNEIAFQIINNIYEKNKTQTKEEIIEKIKIALEKIRFFDGRGYYYLMSMEGVNYFHPIFKNLENTSLLEIQDIKGLYFLFYF